ncbi:hypothetical protein HDU97_009670 [Phlyctochytrium planicorne]|nr:hypothetical protein HDU97_009670 [Phlyctochytrium planicorne]
MSAPANKQGLSYAQQLAQGNKPAPAAAAPQGKGTATTPAASSATGSAQGAQPSGAPGARQGGGQQGPRHNNRNSQGNGPARGANQKGASNAGGNAPPATPAPKPAASGNPPLNFAAAAAASRPAQPPAEKLTANTDQTEKSSTLKPANPASNTDAAPTSGPQKAQSQSRGQAWGAGEGLTFKSNVLPPSQVQVSAKLKFGSQSEIDEAAQNHEVPASVESAPASGAPAVPNSAAAAPAPSGNTGAATETGSQPIAPTPVHSRAVPNFQPVIPRTLSAPPQLDKLNLQNKGQKGASANTAVTTAPAPATVPAPAGPTGPSPAPTPGAIPAEETAPQVIHAPVYVVPTPHQPHLQQLHPNAPHMHHHVAHPGAQGQHHVIPMQHHQFPSGAQPGAHFPPQAIAAQPGVPAYHPGQQGPQPHYNAGRPLMRPPPGNIPPQGVIPGQYNPKQNYKGNQYQPPQGAANIPPHHAGIAQPVAVGNPPQFYPPFYQYGYDPAYGYPQPYYQQGPQQVPYQGPMIRPAAVPGVPPTPQRYPAQAAPAGGAFPPAGVATPAKSKAIRIVNPLTKEDVVVPSKPAVPTPAAAAPVVAVTLPEPVKESPHKAIVIKTAQGDVIELPKTVRTATPATEPVVAEAATKPIASAASTAPAVNAASTEGTTEAAKAPEVKHPVEAKPAKAEVKKEAPVKKEAAAPVPVLKKPDVARARTPSPTPSAAPAPTSTAAPSTEAAEKKVVEQPKKAEPIKVDPAPEPAPVEAEKPAIVVSKASEVELPEVEAPKEELEEGELVPTAADIEEAKKAVTGGITEKALAEEPEAAKEEVVEKPSPKKPTDFKILSSFEGLVYPEEVPAPEVVNGTIKFSLKFLMACSTIMVKPHGLPDLSIFSESEKQASPRNSRPTSGSGHGSYSGSMAPSGHNTPKRTPTGGYHLGVKGIMPSVVAPSSSRPGSNRNSIGPGSNLGYNAGAGRNSQGSWDSKGNQGLPPRPGGGKGRDRQQYNAPPEPPVEALKISANAWVPDARKGGARNAEEDEQEAKETQTVKTAKGLLNKLTIEKFDPITDKFISLPIETESILKKIIVLIFDKALDEHHFQSMYAKLCQKLSNELPKVQKWIDMDTRNNIFRRALLNKCQEEYEKNEKWSKSDADGALSRKERLQRLDAMSSEEKAQYAEDEFQRNKLKRRVLGNMSFIGELFKISMITEKIMHSCVKQLLSNINDPEEEETECVCKLLRSIGQRLDHAQAKSHMDAYFSRIKDLSVNNKLAARIRFMLQDLIEQRANGWKARQEATGPMTIAEIQEREERKQREEEEALRQRQAAGPSRGGKGGRGGRGGDSYGGRGPMGGKGSQDVRAGGDGGWNTVQERARSTRHVEDNLTNFGKLDVKKPSSGMHFGPPQSTWGRGAQGGATREEKTEARPPTTPMENKFSLLLNDGEPSERKKSVDIARSSPDASRKPSTEAPASTAAPTKISKSQATKKIANTLQEWFSLWDQAEFAASQREFGTDEYNEELISTLLEEVLNKKRDDVKKTAALLKYLVKEGVVSEAHVLASLSGIAENLQDISIDVPEAYRFFGIFYGNLLPLELPEFSLSALVTLLQPVIETKNRILDTPKLLAEVFLAVVDSDSELFLQRILAESQVDLKVFWPADRRSDDLIAEWLDANNLFFINPLLKVSRGLKTRLGEPSSALEWLQQDEITAIEQRDEVGFVRIVALSILRHLGLKTIFANGVKNPLELSREHFVKQEEILSAHKELLDTFIQKNSEKAEEKKIEILFACQEYWVECEKLKTFLEHLFRILLKISIVEEDAVASWRTDKVRLQSSKKAALEELSSWFKSMQK